MHAETKRVKLLVADLFPRYEFRIEFFFILSLPILRKSKIYFHDTENRFETSTSNNFNLSKSVCPLEI